MDRISAYQQAAYPHAQDIVVAHAELVRKIAYHLKARLPQNVLIDDLIQAGMMGLLDAFSHYQADKGASFETYASIRIRGAMLDEIRKNDWVPRSVHRTSRKITEVINKIENEKGRDAKEHEIADALDLSLSEYHKLINNIRGTKIVAFDDMGSEEDNYTQIPSQEQTEPLEGLQSDNFKSALAAQIAALPERERLVLTLYYEHELNLKEIGEIIGVSESRVCQIHSQATLRLKSRLQEWQ